MFRLSILMAFIALVACSEATLDGGPFKSSGTGDEVKAKSTADPAKPSEETEGVPGYLVDPELVSILVKDDTVTVKGAKGAVKTPDEEEAIVSILVTSTKELATAQTSASGTLQAEFKATAQVTEEGAFTIDVSVELGELVIANVAATTTKTISLPEPGVLTSAVAAIFDGASGTFMTLEKYTTLSANNDGEIETDETGEDDPSDDPATDDLVETPSCGGVSVGSACWYLSGDPLLSCATICTAHGGYDEATATYAGSAGTLSQCYEVLGALGVTSMDLGDVASGVGVGCTAGPAGRIRWTLTATTADAILGGFRRACACHE